MRTLQISHDADSRHAWTRLWIALALMTIGFIAAGVRTGTVLMATLFGMALGGWMPGWISDATGSYRAAFANGIAWNMVTTGIALFLLYRARRWVPREA
jgi:hypothetical protein